MVATGGREPDSSTLKAMLEGFAAAGSKGEDAAACVAGAIEAAGRVPFASTEPGMIHTQFTPMLESALEKNKPPELSADELRQEIHRLINELTPAAEIERAAPLAEQSKGMAP